jgi:hypothetical protein
MSGKLPACRRLGLTYRVATGKLAACQTSVALLLNIRFPPVVFAAELLRQFSQTAFECGNLR